MSAPVGCLGGPSVGVAVSFDVALDYLANGTDVGQVILGVRRAIASAVNAASGTLSIAELAAVAAGVDGVVRVRSVLLNGEANDLTGTTWFTQEQFVNCGDARIVL